MHYKLSLNRKTGLIQVYVDGKRKNLTLSMDNPHDVRIFMNSSPTGEEGSKRFAELEQRGIVEYDTA